MPFAENTSVSVEKSRIEISTLLAKYGATGFRYGWQDKQDCRVEQVDFSTADRIVRFTLKLPLPTDRKFMRTPSGRALRSDPERVKAWEQACRSRWRALVLCVKAKLEAVAIGISTFEEEFLAHIVDPVTGQTIGQIALPRIAQSYADRTPVDLPKLCGPITE